MAKTQPVRMKTPPEFRIWVEKRQSNIEKAIAKKITKMEAMRIISRTDGVDLPDYIVKNLKRNKK